MLPTNTFPFRTYCQTALNSTGTIRRYLRLHLVGETWAESAWEFIQTLTLARPGRTLKARRSMLRPRITSISLVSISIAAASHHRKYRCRFNKTKSSFLTPAEVSFRTCQPFLGLSSADGFTPSFTPFLPCIIPVSSLGSWGWNIFFFQCCHWQAAGAMNYCWMHAVLFLL